MKTTILVILLFGTVSMNAQSIERQVIGSTGGTFSTSSIKITSTVGEVAVATTSSASIIQTEGYQQANDTNMVSVAEIENVTEMKLYPNPTRTSSSLEITSNTDNNVVVSIFSAQGKLIQNNSANLTAGQKSIIQLDLSSQASGVYFVTIKGENNSFVKTIRLVKQ